MIDIIEGKTLTTMGMSLPEFNPVRTTKIKNGVRRPPPPTTPQNALA
ncbi:MAG: hypothetical protein HYU58_17820 [Proteobacteria bacterium]|nr:hypothetical protein [Pseudomonadota bacterium]